jgi:hypothetical protein
MNIPGPHQVYIAAESKNTWSFINFAAYPSLFANLQCRFFLGDDGAAQRSEESVPPPDLSLVRRRE